MLTSILLIAGVGGLKIVHLHFWIFDVADFEVGFEVDYYAKVDRESWKIDWFLKAWLEVFSRCFCYLWYNL